MSIDKTVDPCQDFYAFTCNNWVKVCDKQTEEIARE